MCNFICVVVLYNKYLFKNLILLNPFLSAPLINNVLPPINRPCRLEGVKYNIKLYLHVRNRPTTHNYIKYIHIHIQSCLNVINIYTYAQLNVNIHTFMLTCNMYTYTQS